MGINPPGATLFNNPLLSDVKIMQTYNGQVREYHAHKAILSKESHFFLKAFTGSFKEATDTELELHDDNPDYFEFVLKFLYTETYDKDAITKMVAEDKAQRALIPVGIYAIADKYGIERLYACACEDVRITLQVEPVNQYQTMKAAIEGHYHSCNSTDCAMGKVITSVLLNEKRGFTHEEDFLKLMQQLPVFGADIALQNHREGLFNARKATCAKCGTMTVRSAASYTIKENVYGSCAHCKGGITYTPLR